MTSLINAALPSDDEEDQDFVPDEIDSEEEGGKKSKPSARRKRVRGVATAATSNDEGTYNDQDDAGNPAPLVPALAKRKQAEKKAKVEEIWSKLKQDQPSKPGVNLAQLCKQKSKGTASGSMKDNSWKTLLGIGTSSTKKDAQHTESTKDKTALATAALAAAKSAASATAAQNYGMVTVQETRRFAGQTITVNKQVEAGSKEAEKAEATAHAAGGKKAGLDAVLASLAQAKKVTVLDKSQADWKDFKKKDETVEEELEAHKRSGATFLEKQAFLGRAELAEYEKERDARLASDVRNRGWL